MPADAERLGATAMNWLVVFAVLIILAMLPVCFVVYLWHKLLLSLDEDEGEDG